MTNPIVAEVELPNHADEVVAEMNTPECLGVVRPSMRLYGSVRMKIYICFTKTRALSLLSNNVCLKN